MKGTIKGKRKGIYTRLRERAGEAKKSLVREAGGFDMSTPMARGGLWMSSDVLWRRQRGLMAEEEEEEEIGRREKVWGRVDLRI